MRRDHTFRNKAGVWLCTVALIAGVGVIAAGSWGSTVSAHEEAGLYANMKKSVLSAVTEKIVRVTEGEFGLSSEVEMTDQYRRPVLREQLTPGQDIFFRLDRKGLIDKIVLIIPS